MLLNGYKSPELWNERVLVNVPSSFQFKENIEYAVISCDKGSVTLGFLADSPNAGQVLKDLKKNPSGPDIPLNPGRSMMVTQSKSRASQQVFSKGIYIDQDSFSHFDWRSGEIKAKIYQSLVLQSVSLTMLHT